METSTNKEILKLVNEKGINATVEYLMEQNSHFKNEPNLYSQIDRLVKKYKLLIKNKHRTAGQRNLENFDSQIYSLHFARTCTKGNQELKILIQVMMIQD
jgi:hypothetical protein